MDKTIDPPFAIDPTWDMFDVEKDGDINKLNITANRVASAKDDLNKKLDKEVEKVIKRSGAPERITTKQIKQTQQNIDKIQGQLNKVNVLAKTVSAVPY